MTGIVKAVYTRVRKHLPARLAERLEGSLLNPVQLMERLEIRRALRSGPPYRPSHRKIIIDITTACNLRCIDCNRSCGDRQASANEHMSVEQIERFIEESVAYRKQWREIAIEGGEPTLHPRLPEVMSLLVRYRRFFSPRTHIQLLTNGYGQAPRSALEDFRRQDVLVLSTRKTSKFQQHHCAFNVAPCDMPDLDGGDFSQGCFLPACYGLGLTRHGYYPHPICGGIDRVFGFDLGRKHLPPRDDALEEQFERFCRLCGFYRHSRLLKNAAPIPDRRMVGAASVSNMATGLRTLSGADPQTGTLLSGHAWEWEWDQAPDGT